jgi:MATE family multidrug resistance protein
MGATAQLAGPIALAFVAQLGMGVTDTIMLGALGRDALAAGGLATSVFFFGGSILQGVFSAVSILVAHARGSATESRIVPVLRAGYALALMAAVPLMLLLWFAEDLMLRAGEPAALAANVGAYEQILLWATPAFLWLGTQRALLSAMARPRLIMMVSFGALVTNGLLNYGLIHGRFGLPAMGYLGSALATTITIWGQAAAMSLGMRLMRGLPRARLKGPVSVAMLREILVLGIPIGVTVGVEAGVFFTASLLMGLLGATALAAHQVTLQVAATMFMVPLALGQAANVRVGYHTGAGAGRAAQRAGLAAFALGAAFALAAAAAIAASPRGIVLLFGLDPAKAADAEVIALASRLLLVCAALQLVDGAQAIAAGALRGLKDTRVPMVLAALGYWAVGFPAAWLCGFVLGYGAVGVWWGLALGLLAVTLLLTWRFWQVSSSARDGVSIEAAARLAFGPVAA